LALAFFVLGFLLGLPAAPRVGVWTTPLLWGGCAAAILLLAVVKSVMKTHNTAMAIGSVTAELTQEGLIRRTTFRVSLDVWCGILEIGERRSELLFRLQYGQTFWLPRRAFSSPEALEAFVAMARKRHAAATGPHSALPELA
jgi:hypothetical protein